MSGKMLDILLFMTYNSYKRIKGGMIDMTISERIFERLQEIDMSQKEFSEKTGIAQSTISDWKRKRTNPISEKIMIICKTIRISPEELLSGADFVGTRSNREVGYYVIDKNSELGQFINSYQSLPKDMRGRLIGYLKAMEEFMG